MALMAKTKYVVMSVTATRLQFIAECQTAKEAKALVHGWPSRERWTKAEYNEWLIGNKRAQPVS